MVASTRKKKQPAEDAAATTGKASKKDSKTKTGNKASRATTKTATDKKKQPSSRATDSSKDDNHDAVEQLRLAWLPHFDRVLDSSVAISIERVVADITRELDQFLLSHEFASSLTLKIHPNQADQASRNPSQGRRSEMPQDAVAAALTHYLDCALSTSESEETLRLLQVTAAVAVATNTTQSLVDRAVEYSKVLLERVRAHALTFLKAIAHSIQAVIDQSESEKEEENNAILDLISQTLTGCCIDKSKLVRQAAVGALQPLLMMNDCADASAVQSVIWVMQHDSIPANRVAALQALPITVETSEALVARVRDVSAVVRVAALQKLATADVLTLDAELMAAIVQAGYTERCSDTRQATVALVGTWMQTVEYKPLIILERLSLINYEAQCEVFVKILLELSKTSFESRQALLESLETLWKNTRRVGNDKEDDDSQAATAVHSHQIIEAIFLARVACKADPSLLDRLDDDWDVPHVTAVLEKHVQALRNSLLQEVEDQPNHDSNLSDAAFICQQLLLLASVLASAEEGAARHLRHVLCLLLSDAATPDDLIATTLQALYGMSSSSSSSSNNKTINSSDDSTTGIVVDCIRRLQTHQTSSMERETLSYYQIRMLSILTVLLENLACLTPDVDQIVDDVLEPILNAAFLPASSSEGDGENFADTALVREVAVTCLGKLGLLWLARNKNDKDDEAAQDRIHNYRRQLLDIALRDDKVEIQAQALMALTDWAIIGMNEDLEDLEELIASFLDQDDLFLVCVAAEVSVKLLFANSKLSDPKNLLARLVILSFDSSLTNQQQEGENEIGCPIRLQQLLSFFFPAYSSNAIGRQALLGCLPQLLSLSKKKTARMVSYVCDVVRQGCKGDAHVEEDAFIDSVAVDAAIEIATFILNQEPTGTYLRTVCKVMGGFTLIIGDLDGVTLPSHIRRGLSKLENLLEEVGMIVTDDVALDALGYLQESLAVIGAGRGGDDESEHDSDGSSTPKSQSSSRESQDSTSEESTLIEAFNKVTFSPSFQFSPNKENETQLTTSKSRSRSSKDK